MHYQAKADAYWEHKNDELPEISRFMHKNSTNMKLRKETEGSEDENILTIDERRDQYIPEIIEVNT